MADVTRSDFGAHTRGVLRAMGQVRCDGWGRRDCCEGCGRVEDLAVWLICLRGRKTAGPGSWRKGWTTCPQSIVEPAKHGELPSKNNCDVTH